VTLVLAYGGLHKVISGGQTGADQGGLLAAWQHCVQTGGTAPERYLTQNGPNLLLRTLGLTAVGTYASRTKVNVRDSDATVIIAHNPASPGTALTVGACVTLNKPYLILDIRHSVNLELDIDDGDRWTLIKPHCEALYRFCIKHGVLVLNVAGNREILAVGQAGGLIMTSIAEDIVFGALELLRQDDLLISRP
jgi:hypothetical protein